MNPKNVFAIGRWMPIHLGHKQFLTGLAQEFDHLIIGIGSCFENGTPRNCIPAIEREKLLRRILATEGLTNVTIVHIQDKPTFEEWIDDVCRVCREYNVTHFCTGNKEDILNVMEQMGITLDLEMIDPEVDSPFPYHATDVRNTILEGNEALLDTMLPPEIKPMVIDQIAREIQAANQGKGKEFIPGRQTVDLVLLVRHTDEKIYALIGRRDHTKVDFPDFLAIPGGKIREFESPIQAATRCFLAETGLQITVTDNSTEPAAATLNGQAVELHFTGIYASHDERINGTRGGGSQCFALLIDGDIHTLTAQLHSTHDLKELAFVEVDSLHTLTLAYDQKRMLLHALNHLGIAWDNGERLAVFAPDGTPTGEGVLRTVAHRDGILHAAAHIFICRRQEGTLYYLLQRRSAGKDSYPNCLDLASAGHVALGDDLPSTALKELNEELGLTFSAADLKELFTQTVDVRTSFRGKPFHDLEYNVVYLLTAPLCEEKIILQTEELSEVVWQPEEQILAALANGNPEYCMNAEEFRKAAEILNQIL